jgi:hypothetical protein
MSQLDTDPINTGTALLRYNIGTTDTANTVADATLASLRFARRHLNVPLVRCFRRGG